MTNPAAASRHRLQGFVTQALGLGLFYVIVVVYFSTNSEYFFTTKNMLAILSAVAVLGVVAVGQTLAIISGGFDLSVSGVLPLGAVAFAMLVNAGVPLGLATLGVVAIGAVFGLANGLIVTKAKIDPLITTLGTLSISAGLAYSISGGVTVPFADAASGFWGSRAVFGVQWSVIAFVLLAALGVVVLRMTVFGRSIYAVGGNKEASRLAGMNVDALTLTVYVLCACCAAFAGVLSASQLLAGSATVGVDSNLRSITAVILGGAALFGGVGGVGGTMLGVLLLGTIVNGMALLQVPSFYQQIATGFVLLIAVGFGRMRTALMARMNRTSAPPAGVPSVSSPSE